MPATREKFHHIFPQDTVRARKCAVRHRLLAAAVQLTIIRSQRETAQMNKPSGFTLIEVMIVVVVIGILAAVAWPSYQDHVRKSNRAAAQQLMLDIASRQEQYLLDARNYTATLGTSAGLNLSPQGWNCTGTITKCTNSFYEITVAVTAAAANVPPAHTITATAIGSQATDGNLTLNNVGQKTPTAKWGG
jgi:type IV pilus assembly protein PilE